MYCVYLHTFVGIHDNTYMYIILIYLLTDLCVCYSIGFPLYTYPDSVFAVFHYYDIRTYVSVVDALVDLHFYADYQSETE